MNRTSLLVALVALVGVLVVPAAGVAAQETENETDADMAPGERLSGVVGVQSAEFDGEIERNAFRIGLERADDNATKARRIAEKLNETETRLAELRERKSELREQRANGTISDGQYRARIAALSAETETAKQQLNRSNATAAELPAETLEANGVNATAIRTLMNDADELSGGDVAEIARSIAGDRSGMVDRGAAGDRNASFDDGAGDRPGENRSETEPGDRTGPDSGDGTPDGVNDEQGPGNETTTDDADSGGSDTTTDRASSDESDIDDGSNDAGAERGGSSSSDTAGSDRAR